MLAKTRPPEGLQLDLLSALVRLGDIADRQGCGADSAFVLDRVLTCDVPRLWAYVDTRTLAWMQDQTPAELDDGLGVARAAATLRSRAVVWFGRGVAFAAGCVITAYFMSPPW